MQSPDTDFPETALPDVIAMHGKVDWADVKEVNSYP